MGDPRPAADESSGLKMGCGSIPCRSHEDKAEEPVRMFPVSLFSISCFLGLGLGIRLSVTPFFPQVAIPGITTLKENSYMLSEGLQVC